ncbi:hypothetical protein AB0B66_37260 [Catellatospora sp. NPDC049111]|uniref:hypothetical protein n=1 Tax=Catellatospora sp. NPDC049111 TaxID=3155271 RepID=UPI0033D34C3E
MNTAAKDGPDDSPAPAVPEPDPALEEVAQRAVDAGHAAWWTRFKDPRSGALEGPLNLRLELKSGRGVRSIHLNASEAAALARFNFERWTPLGPYQAILDPDAGQIMAEVELSGTGLYRLSSATLLPPDETQDSTTTDIPNLLGFPAALGDPLAPRSLTVTDRQGILSVELRSMLLPQLAAFRTVPSTYGNSLIIRGVKTTRHDEALALLRDLSTSIFIDLDISYGLTGELKPALDVKLLASEEYDKELPSSATPQFPTTRYSWDAAALYLYARRLINTPLLEYLAYYQVLESYFAAYSRETTLMRLRNLLKDPSFRHDDDVALGRLLDAVSPDGRTRLSEREQLAATIASCVEDHSVTSFLEDRPATAKALGDRTRISGVRLINPADQKFRLVSQVAERVYDIRCRIVHNKEGFDAATRAIRPFDRESKLLRHDLHLLRFITQRVLIASSRATDWSGGMSAADG